MISQNTIRQRTTHAGTLHTCVAMINENRNGTHLYNSRQFQKKVFRAVSIYKSLCASQDTLLSSKFVTRKPICSNVACPSSASSYNGIKAEYWPVVTSCPTPHLTVVSTQAFSPCVFQHPNNKIHSLFSMSKWKQHTRHDIQHLDTYPNHVCILASTRPHHFLSSAWFRESCLSPGPPPPPSTPPQSS